MKKLLALLLTISTIMALTVGCQKKTTPAVAPDTSSEITSDLVSDLSSAADSSAVSSASSSAVSSKAVSSKPKTVYKATATVTSSSQPVSSASDKDKLIAAENARHTAVLKSLEDTYNSNMALFAERDKYIAQRATLQTSLNTETDATKKADLNAQINSYDDVIEKDYNKMLAIAYPGWTRQRFINNNEEVPTEIRLKYKISEKYKNDIAAENSKHNEIMKQLG